MGVIEVSSSRNLRGSNILKCPSIWERNGGDSQSPAIREESYETQETATNTFNRRRSYFGGSSHSYN